jgi:uncharacterized protein DUF87
MLRPDARVTFFAETNHRNNNIPFGIRQSDRLAHMYAIGKTGTGKSTLLETLIRQDIQNYQGLALLDPHGDMVEKIMENIPDHRKNDVVYFDITDPTQPLGYNPLKRVAKEKRPLAASGLLEVFKKMWEDAWGPRMEHLLRNAILALLDYPTATLPDILRMFYDESFRKQVCTYSTNPQVKSFWLQEYQNYTPRLKVDAAAPIQNKVGAFLADPNLYRIFTETEKTIHVRRIMDEGKILLINLSKGKIGEDSSALLGGLLVTTISLAAFSRADTPEHKRRNFFLYIDEFQNFTTMSMANMTAELRKYHVGLILANQYLDQLDPGIRDAVLGNIGTLISFRLGPKDAPFIAKEFSPKFDLFNVMSLPNYHIYLKLMIEGSPSKPFSANTLRFEDIQ